MQMTTGTVIQGKIVVEGATLIEGDLVTVMAREIDESFSLSQEDEEQLLAAMAEIEAGHFLPAAELIQNLRSAH